MNSKLNVPARATVFALLTLLVIAAALTLPKLSPVAVFAQTSPPDAPTGLMARATGTDTVELYWTAPSNDGGADITGYMIERYDSTATPPAWSTTGGVADTGNTDTHAALTSVAAGENRYRVSAINSEGSGRASSVVSVTPPTTAGDPGAPTALVAEANGPAEINLTWTAPAANGGADITGYMIEYTEKENTTPAPILPWMVLAANTGNDKTEYSNTGLNPTTKRWYRVSAINADDERGPVATAVAATTTAKGIPAAPTGLKALVVATDNIELYWTAPAMPDAAPITGYTVEWSTDGKTWPDTNAAITVSSGKTPYASHSEALAAASKRYYRVSAMNSIGRGLVSETATAVSPESGKQPGAPAELRAVASGSTSISLLWAAPSTGASLTSYVVEYAEKAGDGNTDNAPVGALPWKELTTTSSNTASHTGLNPETKRWYRVAAINSKGRGLISNVASATTAVAPADQMGTVTLSTQAPMVGTAITANLTDDDGMTSEEEWQWQKSMTPTNMNSWMDISGAMAMSYTPAMADEGYYLRATVTYTDAKRSDRTAYSEATTGKVMIPADQTGTVTLSTQEPMAGTAITASLMDANGGVTGEMWQWQKSMTPTDMDSWMDAMGMGAMTYSYTPETADAGYHLRATVAYSDSVRSGRMAYSEATTGMVMIPEDQPGTLTLSSMKPVVGMMLTATLMDPDEYMEDSVDWQWSRSMTLDGTFEHIDEESMSYTPKDADVGYYLKVAVAYTDGHGPDKSEEATTTVVVRTALMAKFDTNENAMIDRSEAIKALQSYLDGDADVSRDEAIGVLRLYLSN